MTSSGFSGILYTGTAVFISTMAPNISWNDGSGAVLSSIGLKVLRSINTTSGTTANAKKKSLFWLIILQPTKRTFSARAHNSRLFPRKFFRNCARVFPSERRFESGAPAVLPAKNRIRSQSYCLNPETGGATGRLKFSAVISISGFYTRRERACIRRALIARRALICWKNISSPMKRVTTVLAIA